MYFILKHGFTSGPRGPGGPGGPGEQPGVAGFSLGCGSPPVTLVSNTLMPSFKEKPFFNQCMQMRVMQVVCVRVCFVKTLQGCLASTAEEAEGRAVAEAET